MLILDVAPNLAGAGRAANPIAGQVCYLGLAWGPGFGMGSAQEVQLSIDGGAIIDRTFSSDQIQANVVTAPYAGINMGWHPDNTYVWLTAQSAAYGLWKVTFPTVATYNISLPPSGSTTITSVPAPAAPTLCTLVLLRTGPMGLLPSRIFQVSFSGNYPAGGFPIRGNDLGLGTPFFAHIDDTSLYRFVYDVPTLALRVYGNAGEVATNAALVFTTQGIFHGSCQ